MTTGVCQTLILQQYYQMIFLLEPADITDCADFLNPERALHIWNKSFLYIYGFTLLMFC